MNGLPWHHWRNRSLPISLTVEECSTKKITKKRPANLAWFRKLSVFTLQWMGPRRHDMISTGSASSDWFSSCEKNELGKEQFNTHFFMNKSYSIKMGLHDGIRDVSHAGESPAVQRDHGCVHLIFLRHRAESIVEFIRFPTVESCEQWRLTIQ